MLQILELVVFTSLGIFFGFYLFYFMLCIRYKKNQRLKRSPFSNKKIFPTVSIIIPTYNEAGVISKKFDNLQGLHYPKDKLQIVFVDGGSADGTAELIEDLAKKTGLSVIVVQQGRRKGFNKAVIDGFGKTTGDIICITGAETEYDAEALTTMVGKFRDSRIGAVTGKQQIKNIDEGYSPKLEVAYRSLYDFIREAESCIDSPFDIKGEICAARRNIVSNLVKKPELSNRGCIDCCISFQAKMNGYSSAYEPKAIYYELSPKSVRDSFKQQVRRAATLIENMMTFKDMILNKRFGAFGMIIMPAHFLMLVILPFLLLIGAIGMVLLAIWNPSNYIILSIGGMSLLLIFLSAQFQAFLKTQVVLIIATLNLFFGVETQKFERLQSTRA